MSVYVFECTTSEKAYLEQSAHNGPLRTIAVPFLNLEQARKIADAEIISTFVHSRVTDELMAALPKLRLITTRSTGYDHIDVVAAERRNITVCSVPNYGESTVAEHAWSLLLALSRNIIPAVASVRSGEFANQSFQGFDLAGHTIGVVGAGRIGKRLLRMAQGFQMRLLAYDQHPDEALASELGVTYVSLEELLRSSDVLSFHVKQTPETYHLMNSERFSLCKDGVVVINTARGEIIDTAALVQSLQSGKVAAAGLDVLECETEMQVGILNQDVQQLLAMPNVLITPHIAFNTAEAVRRIIDTTVANITQFQAGTPQNVCTK